MTASTRLRERLAVQPGSGPSPALAIAHEILQQVRVPEAIFLRDIEFAADSASGLGEFLCHRPSHFPNPNLRELTGGQLIDASAQMAYCLTGLMIHGGVDLLGLDLAGYMDEIHAHGIHAVRTDITFCHPCKFDQPFTIGARLERFRNGELSLLQRNPRRYFVRLELKGAQRSGGPEGQSLDIFRARMAACRPLS